MFDILAEADRQIGLEGKYSNDPKDSGGETMWGVTAAVARAYGYPGPMRDLPRDTAKRIFIERYWLAPKFDQVAGVCEPLAAKLFEIGINMGQARGVAFLQRALNVLNQEAALYPDIAVDGTVGKITLHCLKSFLQHRGVKGQDVLLQMVKSQQSVRYIELAEARPKDERFEFGWQANRV